MFKIFLKLASLEFTKNEHKNIDVFFAYHSVLNMLNLLTFSSVQITTVIAENATVV